jgi:hypothetical protein
MKNTCLVVLFLVSLVACSKDTSEPMAVTEEAAEEITVSFENYNQAETARNFNNWARLGAETTCCISRSCHQRALMRRRSE